MNEEIIANSNLPEDLKAAINFLNKKSLTAEEFKDIDSDDDEDDEIYRAKDDENDNFFNTGSSGIASGDDTEEDDFVDLNSDDDVSDLDSVF